VSTCLFGCVDSIAHPYRPIYTDGGTGGTGEVDAGPPDIEPITCPTKLVGFATMDGGTTGGAAADAATFTVDALAQLRTYAGMPGPAVVRISGVLGSPTLTDPQATAVEIESDKTIVGVKPGDGLVGTGFLIKDRHNVIIHNLKIAKVFYPYDAITIQNSTHVWVDHCDLSTDLTSPAKTYDGLVDITHGSFFVTVSWTSFHDHINTSLVGHTDTPAASDGTEDLALAVTFHHNQFLRTPSGSPRARFGHVHLFNNHYDTIQPTGTATTSYGIAAVMGAMLRVEANAFDQVAVPIITHIQDTPLDGSIGEGESGNSYTPMSSAAANMITVRNTWPPPYLYSDSLDSASGARVIVDACAGVGKVP